MPRPPHRRRGFARVEAASLLVVALTMIALATVATDRNRRQAMTAGSLSNLQWFAAATTAYAADNDEQYWAYSWKGSTWYGEWYASSDRYAQSNQAVDILRRRAEPEMPKFPAWIPHVLYAQLPLYDYLGVEFPVLRGVSPGDRWRMAWAKDPEAFMNGEFLPFQPEPDSFARRWPYSSSYHLPPAFYDQSPVGYRVRLFGGLHWLLWMGEGTNLTPQVQAAVSHPSEKVHLFEGYGWEWRRPAFYAYPEARVNILFADGSAGLRTTRDANPGWQPNDPYGSQPSYTKYLPELWEPPQLENAPELLEARYRFTRVGLKGRDFGGPEVPTK